MTEMIWKNFTKQERDLNMIDAPIIRTRGSKRKKRKLKNGCIKASIVIALLTGIFTICSDVLTPLKIGLYAVSMLWLFLVLAVNWEHWNG